MEATRPSSQSFDDSSTSMAAGVASECTFVRSSSAPRIDYSRHPAHSLQGRMHEARPFVFIHPRSQRTSILCFTQKAGSTAWIDLLMEARKRAGTASPSALVRTQTQVGALALIDPRSPPSCHRFGTRAPRGNVGIDQPTPFADAERSGAFVRTQWRALMENVSVPRVRLVRSPYERVLSAYLDKLVLTNTSRVFDRWLASLVSPPGFRQHKGSFGELLGNLTQMNPLDRHVDPHFRLQNDTCGLPYNAPYDLVLRVEDEPSWYDSLVSILGLDSDARDGPTKHWMWAVGRPCFYARPGHDCNGTALATPSPPPPSIVPTGWLRNASAEGQDRLNWREVVQVQGHGHGSNAARVTGAALRLGTYYDARLASMVSEWARADLESFGYREWAGPISGEPQRAPPGEQGQVASMCSYS